MTIYTQPPRPGQQFMDSRDYRDEPSSGQVGESIEVYNGSQKDMFIRSVELRITYLEDLLGRLPKQIDELQMQQKISEDELSKLYHIIPQKPKVIPDNIGTIDYNRVRR